MKRPNRLLAIVGGVLVLLFVLLLVLPLLLKAFGQTRCRGAEMRYSPVMSIGRASSPYCSATGRNAGRKAKSRLHCCPAAGKATPRRWRCAASWLDQRSRRAPAQASRIASASRPCTR